MALDIYTSKHQQIKEARQVRDTKIQARLAQKLAKQVNQRFYRLEKKGVGVNDTAYKYAQRETGKEKPRYSVNLSKLEQMSSDDLNTLLLELNSKIISKTSTIRGLKEVEENRIQASKKALGLEGIEDGIFKKFLRDGGGELLNDKYLSSNQVMEDYANYVEDLGVNYDDFITAYRKYSTEEPEHLYDAVIDELENLGSNNPRRSSS